MKRVITIRLSKEESEGLMNAGNRGVEDLRDADGDKDHIAADAAELALNKLGQAMSRAWPDC